MTLGLQDSTVEQSQHILKTIKIESIAPDHEVITKITEGLFSHYTQKYGDFFKDVHEKEDINQFKAPFGAYLTIKHHNEYIAMGAFRLFEDKTAELKRIWTHPQYRKLGLASTLVNELEKKAHEMGYTKIFLTTGFKQPEAVKLYCKLGYTPLFDMNQPMENYAIPPFDGRLRFIKQLN